MSGRPVVLRRGQVRGEGKEVGVRRDSGKAHPLSNCGRSLYSLRGLFAQPHPRRTSNCSRQYRIGNVVLFLAPAAETGLTVRYNDRSKGGLLSPVKKFSL